MKAANRVVVNTGILYGKMLITIVISLYSTRLILGALGEVDYGVFNLVGGVIGMLSFLNSAMAVSTQRYLSYYLGGGEKQKLNMIFQTSIFLHLIIGLLVVILLEVGGIFLFNGVLNIPPERVYTAKLVFHFMVVSTFFTINAVPYDASINAHENMLVIALVDILEAFIKLGIALWLIYTKVDQLVLYGALYAGMTILIRIIKSIYCSKKYKECHIRIPFRMNTVLLREMFSFAGWNLFGSLCNVAKNQGIAIILNIFFGVIINAAYGIANQINGQLLSFSGNIIKALNPQIAKSEGGGNRERMLKLAMLACKMSFLLFAFFVIPLMIEMPYVLKIWLKHVPDNTVIFSRLILLVSLIQQLTVGLMRAIQSVGKIKVYQIVIGSLLIFNIPVALILIKLGFPAFSVLVGSVLLELIAGGTRVLFARRLTGLKESVFFKNIVFGSVLSVVLSFFVASIPHYFISEGFFRLIITVALSTSFLLLFAGNIAVTKNEKEKIMEVLRTFRKRVKK